jgi:hypothetical protein
MKTRLVMALIMSSLLAVASPVMAQDSAWYAGIGAGKQNTTYRPYYTYYMGGTPDQFENKADGLQLELFAGRQLRRTDDGWSLSLEANASFNSFEWSLSIPEEPSRLEYSTAYRFGLSLVPEMRFGRISVYADVGGGAGRVHEMKTSTVGTVSRYDYDRIRPTFTFGGGIKLQASRSVDLFAHVGQTRYFGVAYDSFSPVTGNLPAVSKVEHVTDKPRATGFAVGLIKRF